MTVALHWFRRDLRLDDNQALQMAGEAGRQVVCCFVIDPRVLSRPDTGGARVRFLLGALVEVDARLRERGSALLVRHGDAVEEVPRLAAELGVEMVTAVRDAEPFARDRDRRVHDALRAAGCAGLHLTDEQTIAPLGEILKEDGSPYTVFTPFRRRVDALLATRGPGTEARPPLDRLMPRARLPRLDPLPAATALGVTNTQELPVAGETAARARLRAFAGGPGLRAYAEGRNRLDIAGSSKLSPDLRFGCLSVRTGLRAALEVRAEGSPQERAAVDAWVAELVWRDFYASVLWHLPNVEGEAFRPEMRALEWDVDADGSRFDAWTQGRTGYPVVDAAMRQLQATAWMHNRARMIVASFLTKDLHLDWRAGERWFMLHLVDGDLAANNGGWQWTASTGTDPQPYFRIFNPVLQGERHDPEGAFVRRWVPELAGVPAAVIHRPWEMSPLEREACGLRADAYAERIVDHDRERAIALQRYSTAAPPGPPGAGGRRRRP